MSSRDDEIFQAGRRGASQRPPRDDGAAARALSVPSRRLERLARLGGLAGAVGARMATGALTDLAAGRRRSARDLLLTPSNLRRIADDLARMRGAAMKVGQLISMDAGEMLPPELADMLARLRAQADVMPARQLRATLDAQWGRDWRGRFARFDARPLAAASIGQVHYAETRDGRRLAVKVQYPGVKRSIRSDVDNVAALVRMSGLAPSGLDLDPLLEDAKRQLEAEADYAREAAELAAWGERIAGLEGLAAPRPHADLCTPEVLAMDFMDGRRVETLADDAAPRTRAAGLLIDLALRELFEFSAMQTDPNFANYLWDATGDRLVLLDFGASRALPASTVEGYRALLRAGLSGDRDGIAAAARTLGLVGPGDATGHRDAVLDMIGRATTALAEDWPLSRVQAELLPELRAKGLALAEDGGAGSTPPMSTLLVQRKLAGVFLLVSRLRVDVRVRAAVAARLDPQPSATAAF
ncbi:AarF/ABC1/UbiB kinase family protein [Albimonas sp. CAU 1670]|uniref:ABC1 kinase family protein n=1 Tax=Albimonas sp. CAU 1670 TaxID=3032599 RepID=UPI0023DBEA7B|nr:AarF/ABC1/UbiB kinase family protein [Albimonas sp. CAU 1670]MDF2235357.1 AarF/ABC1/UbiB kinase family protein [Albimonas sp. CAU 1670]